MPVNGVLLNDMFLSYEDWLYYKVNLECIGRTYLLSLFWAEDDPNSNDLLTCPWNRLNWDLSSEEFIGLFAPDARLFYLATVPILLVPIVGELFLELYLWEFLLLKCISEIAL